MIRLIYVAGKFTGKGATEAEIRADVERNIAAAVEVGLSVARLGAMPIVPHANTADARFEAVQPYAFWIEGTEELLRRCDALITVSNWEQSTGATGEVLTAQEEGLPVFHDLESLDRWLRTGVVDA